MEDLAKAIREAIEAVPSASGESLVGDWFVDKTLDQVVAAALAAIEAKGWAVVPAEPTETMLDKGGDAFALGDLRLPGNVWEAMIDARPKVKP